MGQRHKVAEEGLYLSCACSCAHCPTDWAVRARVQVLELEGKITQLEEGSGKKKPGGGDGLPRAPEKHVLSGHRANVTSVRMHPQYTQLASGSEDATIKVWDLDTGDLERTLKGHTNAVQQLAFDPTGAVMGMCARPCRFMCACARARAHARADKSCVRLCLQRRARRT